jgi:hypothetical protein
MKIESSFGVDSNPTPAANAFLVAAPTFETEVQQIERDVVRGHISPAPTRAGRIRGSIKFKHDVIGSGNTDGTVPPAMGTLLRASGMAETAFTDPGMIQYWARVGNAGTMTLANSGTGYTLNHVRYITLECTTGGDSGTAVVKATAPEMVAPDGSTVTALNNTNLTLTNSTPISIGNGAQLTPTNVLGLEVGDKWVVQCGPEGYLYTPVSSAFESASGYVYYEGLLHKSLGMRGSWSLEAQAGNIASMDFTFQGDFAAPTDAALPTDGVFPEQVPPQVELADVRMDNALSNCPASFSVDLANQIEIKECVNAAQGYAGGLIVGRAPTVKFDPEFAPEATYDYWAKLRQGTEIDFSANIGTERGNSMHILSHMQLTNLGYGERARQRTYDVEGKAISRFGNDEISLYFY